MFAASSARRVHGNPGRFAASTSVAAASAVGGATCTAMPSMRAECFREGPLDAGWVWVFGITVVSASDSPGTTATRKLSTLKTPRCEVTSSASPFVAPTSCTADSLTSRCA